jgi:hypothetical protein
VPPFFITIKVTARLRTVAQNLKKLTKSISFNKVVYGDVLQKARVCMGVDLNDEVAAEAIAATEQGGEAVGVTVEEVELGDASAQVVDEAGIPDANVGEEVTVSVPTDRSRYAVPRDHGDDMA